MKIGRISDCGIAREQNEDSYIIDEAIGLYLVADGVGGHQAGEIASRTGAETICRTIKNKLADQDGQSIELIIKEAIDSANREVLNQATSNSNFHGMGSTVVLGLYRNDKLYIAHVGDSRAYLINSNDIILLTEDHSIVASLVRAGKITEKEARNHNMRHIITQCLGSQEYFGPEIKIIDFKKDDTLLLCSDGLTDMVEDSKIKKTVLKKRKDLQDCAWELVRLANKNGGLDNITIILAEKN